MKRYADVSLPVNLDREFTYLIPPEFETAAVVGARAVVPFGRKYATGLITGLPAATTVTGLKPLHDVIDPSPIVSEELLWVCRWIAGYYLSPLGNVLKAAMPQGFSLSSKRIVRALPALTQEAIDELTARAPKQAEAASFIREKGEAAAGDVQKKTGVRQINALLNGLVLAGLIASEEFIPRPEGKPKFVEVVQRSLLRPAAIRAALENLPPRRKKVRVLLEELLARAGGTQADTQVRDLLRHTGASLTQFRELVRSGVIATERVEVSREQDFGTEVQTLGIVLNESQGEVLSALTGAMERGAGGTYLVHGVTGSGKTQVYIEAIRRCLSLGKSAIVLVPEISLTPQMVRRFKSHFGNGVAVVHSRMSPGERHDAWRRAQRGEARIVIGPRSAVFAPLANLGLIVVDEEHEASYKQFDSSPRYNARDVAVVRGGHAGAVVVLGSATPSLESYSNAESGKYTLLEMPRRIDDVPMPSIAVVDMTAERKRLYAAAKEALPPDQRAPLKKFVQPSISTILREKNRGAPRPEGRRDTAAEPPRIRAVRGVRRMRVRRDVRQLQRHAHVPPREETSPLPLLRDDPHPAYTLPLVRRGGHQAPRHRHAESGGGTLAHLSRGPRPAHGHGLDGAQGSARQDSPFVRKRRGGHTPGDPDGRQRARFRPRHTRWGDFGRYADAPPGFQVIGEDVPAPDAGGGPGGAERAQGRGPHTDASTPAFYARARA
jgi:primosomal protein N' (replication factor Y)